MNIDEKLKYYVRSITNAMSVDLIILFGSYAKGTENENSDIDIAIISPDFKTTEPVFENVLSLTKKADLMEPGLQLIAFPSKTFQEETYIDPVFIREIKKTGKVIYRRSD